MTTPRFFLLAAALAIALSLGGGSPVVGESPERLLPAPVWFGTELEVKPEGNAEGVWVCELVLRDLASDEVLVAPSVVFPAGEPARVNSRLPGGTEFSLEVSVGEDGDVANWKTEVRFEEQLLNVQKGTVRLGARTAGEKGS